MSSVHVLKKNSLVVAIAGVLAVSALPAQAASLENTDIKFGGYLKADAMWSNFSEGDVSGDSIARDFYVPGSTPVKGDGQGDNVIFDAHARQSRFNFKSDTDLGDGNKLTGFLEMDFMATSGGNERVSNSYSPRLRHAFLKYNNLLVGQTWSTFQDVKTLPESVDFIGSTDGTIFVRQTQIRYSLGNLELAAENPETTVTPNGGGDRIETDDNKIPDLVARYTFKGDWGHLSLAGMARELAYNNKQDGFAKIDDSIMGYGISATSKLVFGNGDDIRLMANFGSGLGRYMGLNTANGAVIDSNNQLEAIDSYGLSAAYRLNWSDQWRSNFIVSTFSADNDINLTGTGVTRSTQSARVNLMYSPVPKVTFGGELAYANREEETRNDGDLTRVQFMAQYKF